MSPVAGETFGVIGPFEAFPQRLAARETRRREGELRRGVSRRTTTVVVGRKLLRTASESSVEKRIDSARRTGKPLTSENGFLRRLGLLEAPDSPALERRSLLEQSGIDEHGFDLLVLFDVFEHVEEPYSFRDLILARKYAGLLAGGTTWSAIAKSVHRAPEPVASLTALSLQAGNRHTVLARRGEDVSELDGQMLLPIPEDGEDGLEALFADAEEAEEDGRFEEAAALYKHCLGLDPADSTAAFNRAYCLAAAGHAAEASSAYLRTIKLDPDLVEAWFNFAGLLKDRGDLNGARRHLATAIRLDPDYADAVYNLAATEFEAGNLAEARDWWARYIELDDASDWTRNARRGIQYVDLHRGRRSAG